MFDVMGRRAFMAVCGAAASWSAGAVMGNLRTGRSWTVEELRFASFKAWEGLTFRVRHETHGERTLRLDLVEEAPERFGLDGSGKRVLEGFTAYFSEAKGASALPQDTYGFVHDEAGTFSLFMTPIVPNDPARYAYQVVINRLLPQ